MNVHRKLWSSLLATAALIAGLLVTAGPARAAVAAIVGPATAKPGGVIQFSGTSWPPYASVNVYLVKTTSTFVCTLTADSTGVLPAQTCTAPTYLPAAVYTTHADDGHGHTTNATQTLTLGPAISVLSTFNNGVTWRAEAGGTVNLGGHGFAASSSVSSVKIGTTVLATTPASVPIDSTGTFSNVVVTIPAAQAAGLATLTVTDAGAHAATYKLTIYRATITAPAAAKPAALISMSGTKWLTGDSVNVYAHNNITTTNTYLCTLLADDTGAIPSQSCTVSSYLPNGSYALLATDTSVTVSKPLAINAAITVLSTFNNQPTTTAAAGSTVAINGRGFAASSTISTVKIGSTVLATTPATQPTDVNGMFSGAQVTLPTGQAAGVATLTVIDGGAHSATFKLTVFRPTITAPTTGQAGSTIIIGGTKWPLGASVNAYAHNNITATNTFLGTLPADDTGAIAPQSCTLSPYLPNGSYGLLLTNSFVTVSKAITVKAGLHVLNASNQPLASAPVGTAVHLVGYGFAPSSSIVSVKLGTKVISTVPATPPTDVNGSFSGVSFSVPSVAAGTYTLTVKDASANIATAQFTVT